MHIKPHTRRTPQPPIDPALVTPGARFQKNRASHRDLPPRFVVVDVVETVTDASGTYNVVRYHDEQTSRHGKMRLADFVAASEHKIPDAAPVPQEAPMAVTNEPSVRDELTALRFAIEGIHSRLDAITAAINTRGQLRLVGT